MTVSKIGYRAPSDYDPSAKSGHFASNEGMCADVTRSTDGDGYIVETWSDAVGLATFWRADTFTEAVEFADGVGDENACQHDNGVEDIEGVEVCDMCGVTLEPHA